MQTDGRQEPDVAQQCVRQHANPHLWLSRAESGEAIRISPATIFEVAALHTLGRVRLARPIEEWIRESLQAGGIRIAELSPAIALDAGAIPRDALPDPLDRLLVATARRLQAMIHNVSHILGIELLAAAQGIEFLRPLRSSPALEAVHALLRKNSPAMASDRYLAPDIERATTLVTDGSLARVLRTLPALPALWIPG